MTRRKRKDPPPPRNPGYKEYRLRPRTDGQRELMDKIQDHTITLCSGPPGTGKTHIAAGLGIKSLKMNETSKLIITRPAVESSMTLGFLPGSLEEKLAPYLIPIFDELSCYVETKLINYWVENKELEICPIGFFRGRTLKNAFVIVDEAQNCTLGELRTVLSRIGEGSKMVMVGDTQQSDIPDSGFKKLLLLLDGVEDLAVHRFSYQDVVRHPIIIAIEERFQNG